jgi:hypothetical protein
VTTKIVGGSSKQREILREILAGLGPTRLETVEIVPEPEKRDVMTLDEARGLAESLRKAASTNGAKARRIQVLRPRRVGCQN